MLARDGEKRRKKGSDDQAPVPTKMLQGRTFGGGSRIDEGRQLPNPTIELSCTTVWLGKA